MLGRRYAISCSILIVVLLLHILFLIICSLYKITYNKSALPLSRTVDPYIYIPTQQHTLLPPTQTVQPINNQPPVPEPIFVQNDEDIPLPPPEEPNFASLFQKIEETTKTPKEPIIHNEKKELMSSKHGEIPVKIETSNTKTTEKETPPQPPRNVATDTVPIPFLGTDTTELTERDTLFHQFIKAVNIALHISMHHSKPPFSPGVKPVLIRMVIVRTGRLAQAPSILRSSGNAARDAWYVRAIQQASAQFPPIPAAIRLPFAELTYKEGMHAGNPIH